MKSYEPILIICNDSGYISRLNNRSCAFGFEIGNLLQQYLLNMVSQRTWIQFVAEWRNADFKSVHTVTLRNPCTSMSSKTITCECHYDQDVQNGHNEIVIIGVVSNCTADPPEINANSTVQPCPAILELSYLDDASNAVIATDILGRVLYCNEAVETIYGWHPREIVGQMIVDYLCHDSTVEEGEAIMNSLRQGIVYRGEFIAKNRNGEPMEIHITDYPIFNSDGKLIGMIGVSRLINQDVEIVKEKIPVNQAVAECFSKKSVALTRISTTEPFNKIVWVSENFRLDFDINSLDSVLGCSIESIYNSTTGKAHSCTADKNGGHTVTTSRGHRAMEIVDLPSENMRVYLFDPTAKSNIKSALEAASAETESQSYKADFFTTISHEMRTPLHCIIGESNNLESLIHESNKAEKIGNKLTSSIMESVQIINGSSNIQLQLINNVLAIQNLTSSKTDIFFASFNLNSTIDSIVHSNRCLLSLKKLRVSIFVEPLIPKSVVGDRFKVSQVLSNYLGNSVKYANQDSDITIRAGIVDQDIVIGVTDQSPGIPREYQALLFQRHTRVKSRNDQEGAGLGLSICKHLATLLGGKVWYENRDLGGSSFFVSFPLKGANTSPPMAPPSGQESHSTDSPLLSARSTSHDEHKSVLITEFPAEKIAQLSPILIAEDNSLNQRVMMKLLVKFGFHSDQIHVAKDGVEVMKLCAVTRFAIILMDMSMPRMDGVEATRQLRKVGCKTIIVGITANALDEHQQRCLDAGMNDFLVKPIDINAFKKTIFERKTAGVSVSAPS